MDDSDLGGTTTISPLDGDSMTVAPGRGGSGCALGVSYTLGGSTSRWYPRAGMGCNFGKIFSVQRAVDISDVERVTFYARGTTPNLCFSILSTLFRDIHAEGHFTGLTDTGWTRYSVDVNNDIIGTGRADSTSSWPLLRRYVNRITARAIDKEGNGGNGTIMIDDIEFHFRQGR